MLIKYMEATMTRSWHYPGLSLVGMFLLSFLVRPAQAVENLPFEELGGDQCFMFYSLVPKRPEGDHYVELPLELVIDNDQDYRRLFDPNNMRQSCTSGAVPNIIPAVDFSHKTVLALWSSGSCAADRFQKDVVRDDIQKTITYSVRVVASDRSCSGPGLESLNLIAIPKVPPGYKVRFENIGE